VKAIATALRAWIDREDSDLVLAEFNKIVNGCQRISTTAALIEKAKLRKSLGNPPTSPDRHTIGDELIWESLLDGCADDLMIVSRDKTFLDNASILGGEFKGPKRKLVGVTQHLGDALAQLEIPSKVIEQTESDLESVRATVISGNPPCPKCSGHLMMIGFEGDDEDEGYWWECDRCGEMYFPMK
jgi:hypothetical protein